MAFCISHTIFFFHSNLYDCIQISTIKSITVINPNKNKPFNYWIHPIYNILHDHAGSTPYRQLVNCHDQLPLRLQLWWSWLDTRHYWLELQISSHMCIDEGLCHYKWPWSRFCICHFPAIITCTLLCFPFLHCTPLYSTSAGSFLPSKYLFASITHAMCIPWLHVWTSSLFPFPGPTMYTTKGLKVTYRK